MKNSKAVVKLETGLHARPAAIFIKYANNYKSNILLTKGNATVNAKSIMGVMALSVGKGDEIEIRADGEDEEHAIKELKELLEKEKLEDK